MSIEVSCVSDMTTDKNFFVGTSVRFRRQQFGQCELRIKWLLKKRSERRKHCALAVVMRSQKCSPRLPGGAGRPKFNQLEMVTTFTHKPSLVRIDARNFELSWYIGGGALYAVYAKAYTVFLCVC